MDSEECVLSVCECLYRITQRLFGIKLNFFIVAKNWGLTKKHFDNANKTEEIMLLTVCFISIPSFREKGFSFFLLLFVDK